MQLLAWTASVMTPLLTRSRTITRPKKLWFIASIKPPLSFSQHLQYADALVLFIGSFVLISNIILLQPNKMIGLRGILLKTEDKKCESK